MAGHLILYPVLPLKAARTLTGNSRRRFPVRISDLLRQQQCRRLGDAHQRIIPILSLRLKNASGADLFAPLMIDYN